MKNPLPYVFLVGAAVLAPYSLRADGATGAASASSSAGGSCASADAPGGRAGKWREAFGKLELTDAQKTQIRQIRSSTSPGRERRQQIMAVLTPDQKARLDGMIKAHREAQAGG